MKNTIKALSKQFFGAKYESARKSLLAAAILFIAIYAAEIRVAGCPRDPLSDVHLVYPAGVMWQVLTGRRQMEAMQGMLMLPFDHRGFGLWLCLGAGGAYPGDQNAAGLGAVLCGRLMEHRGDHPCGSVRLYGVCSDSGGVSDVPERSCCAAAPLGRRYPGRYFALAPVGGGPFCGGGECDHRSTVSGFCGCL